MKFLANMNIKKCIHYTIILISPLFLFGSCKKNKGECLGNVYSFKETWKITPEKDSIYVGDTIVFSSIIPSNPFDYNTNKKVNFSGNALIGTGLSISRINGYNGYQPALDSFMLYTLEGRFQNNDISPNRIKDIFWLEIGAFYSIKIKMIAKKKGDYVIIVSDAVAKLKNTSECESGGGIQLQNSNLNNNAYLLRPHYGGIVPSRDSTFVYCLRVK